MEEDTVTVDVIGLRVLAGRVERSANALSEFGSPDLLRARMRGSRTAEISTPALVADTFDDVIAAMRSWAGAVRSSADGFERSEQGNAARAAES
jgi:hypothetical protein